MNLFVIETAEDITQLGALGSVVYGPNFFLRVNGLQAANGTWFVNSNTTNVKPLYSGVIPTNVTGTCLLYATDALPTKTKGVDCAYITHSFCEYI